MKTHPDNAAALEKAYAVLANIACNNDDNQVAIAAAGYIAVRIAALGHHLSDLPTPHVAHNATPSNSTMIPNISIFQTVA